MGRRYDSEETDSMHGARIRRVSDGLDSSAARRRIDLSVKNRCVFVGFICFSIALNARAGTPFPKNFVSLVRNIFKRLFRVYAHMYHSHFAKIVALGEEAHLNTSFKVCFNSDFCSVVSFALCLISIAFLVFRSRVSVGRQKRFGAAR